MASSGKFRQKSEHLVDSSERNHLRGHALFVRFLERRGLGHCVRHLSEDFTWNQLKVLSFHDLQKKYGIHDSSDLEKFAKLLQELRREDSSEVEDEVSLIMFYVISLKYYVVSCKLSCGSVTVSNFIRIQIN